MEAWTRVGVGSLQSVESPGNAKETRTGGAALPAVSREPACSCEEGRRELAGHAEGPSSGAAKLAAVGTDVAPRPIEAPRGCR